MHLRVKTSMLHVKFAICATLYYCGVPGSGVCGCGCAAQLSLCCLGVFWLACARAASAAFFISGYTLSERRGFSAPRPTGSLTARVLGNSGSALPQVSVWGVHVLSLVFVLVGRLPGTTRLVSHRLVSAEPRALAATRRLGHSLVFPHIRRKACLSR